MMRRVDMMLGATEARSPMDGIFEMILERKKKMQDCRCGAKLDQFKIVFPGDTVDQFSAVCLACAKGSAWIKADDFSHPIPLLQLAKQINRVNEAVAYLVDQWNEHGGPFLSPEKTIHMSVIYPAPDKDDED